MPRRPTLLELQSSLFPPSLSDARPDAERHRDEHAARPRWPLLYLAQAVIAVATVLGSLALSVRLMAVHDQSVRASQQWAARRLALADLAASAADADAPANDVFDSRDVPGETARLERARARFDAQLLRIRADLTRHLPPDQRALLLLRLDGLDSAMTAMVGDAGRVFAHLRAGDPERAAARMASMDRHFATLNTKFRATLRAAIDIERADEAAQSRVAERLRRIEYGVAFAVLLTIAAIVGYGQRLALRVHSMQEAKDRHLAALGRSEERFRLLSEQLESRVLERTAELSSAMDALGRSEMRFQLVARATNDVIWDWDVREDDAWHSTALHAMFGYAPEEATGATWWLDRTHPDDRDRLARTMDDALRGDRPDYSAEYRFRRADGSYADVFDRGFVMRDETGRATRVVGSVMDVTERRRAEVRLAEQQRFLRQVIDTIPNLVFAKDRAGRFTLANQATADAYGVTPEDLLGRTDAEFNNDADEVAAFRRDDLAVMDSLTEKFIPAEPVTDAAGRTTWLQTVKRPIVNADGRADQVLGVATDVTRHKERKAALAHFAAIVASSTYAIVSTDAMGTIVSWNPGAERLFGYAAAEIIGRSVATLISPADRERVGAYLARLRRGESLHEADETRLRKDGTVVDVALSLAPIHDAAGQFVGASGIYHDIGERKLAEQRLRANEAQLVEAQRLARLGSWELDLATRVVAWSDETYRQLGYEPGSVEPSFDRFIAAVHPDDREFVMRRAQYLMATGEAGDFEFRIVRPDGDCRTYASRGSVARGADGRPVRVMGTARDVTDERATAAELRAAREAAEAASAAKSEFLANMSHEIRTPMNGVLGMLDLALDLADEPEQRDYLGIAKASAESLLGVINDILDFSKVEAGKLDLDVAPFRLGDAIADTASALAVRAHEKGLELTVDIVPDVPDLVVGDSGRLRQIVVNLVANAIKFTHAGEVAIRVACVAATPDDVTLQVSVADTGIGIAADQQRGIFEAFTQADASTTREYGGTGLGLSICARLAALMGGRIWVESMVGQGSTFHVTATFGRHHGESARAVASASGVLAGLPALIVDDNATNRRILERTLAGWAMRAVCVDDARGALEAMERAAAAGTPYRVILLDAHMPETDGFALAERVRQTPSLAGATIMMLSSVEQHGDAVRCRELGIVRYLVKPVARAALLDALVATVAAATATSAVPAAAPRVLPAAVDRDRDARPLRVLLAEDNVVNQKLATTLLAKRGHAVTAVPNGRLAVDAWQRACAAAPFDVVLMDVQMPEMGGFEATAVIRGREAARDLARTRIVALTARAMTGDREACLAAGMDAYVAKPLRPHELFAVLQPPATDEGGAASTDATPDGEAVIDRAMLLATVGGNRALLVELVDLFVTQSPIQLAAIDDAIAASDAGALEHAAHTLKGTLITFAAGPAAAASRALETIGHAGDLSDARALTAARTAYAALVVEVQRVRAQLMAETSA